MIASKRPRVMMSRFRWSRSPFLSIFLLSTGLVPAEAQETPSAVFREAVDVRVVNLEVVATDERGNRVTGLLPGEFRLFVDDVEVGIDYFTEVMEGRAASLEDDEAGESAPALTPGESVERSYVVFIDEFFSLERDRDAVVRSLIDDLDHLEPGDRMAIVAYDGSELALLSHWSSSRSHLRRTLQQALERPVHGLRRGAEQRPVASAQRLQQTGARVTGFEGDLDMVPDVEAMRDLDLKVAVERLERQMEAATSAAAAALRSFSEVPGRKVMLLLSGGWPQSPAEWLSENPPTELLDLWTDREDVFGQLTAAANRLGFTIYSVDVPDSSRALGVVSAGDGDALPSSGLASGTDVRRASQLRHTLEFISRRTGGQPLVGADRGRALTAVAEDTSSYYWLGFTPKWSEDDRARELRVEVTRPGVRVRARSSYLDLSNRRSVAMIMDSALLFDTAPRQHTMPVKLGEPKRARRRALEVPISVAIPVDEVVFLPVGDRFVADLELHLALRDSDGRQSEEITPIPFEIRVNGTPRPGTYVAYDTRVQLRRQPHRIVVAVRDKVGGAVLTGTADFKP
jgi:VWFA-related protein